jgi:hypothetical protein
VATFTSQRLAFRALTLHQRPLMCGVVLPALLAPLVAGIRGAMECSLLALAAFRAAVALPSIIRPTDEEPLQASPAAQREDHKLVHPSRRDENWTATSGSTTVRAYWLSIHRLYMRVQAPTWTLLRFKPQLGPTGMPCVARVFEPCPHRRCAPATGETVTYGCVDRDSISTYRDKHPSYSQT